MTIHEFIMKVHRKQAEAKRMPGDLRPGQIAYNCLHDERPDLCAKIMESEESKNDYDPFYRDEKLPAFWQFVVDNW